MASAQMPKSHSVPTEIHTTSSKAKAKAMPRYSFDIVAIPGKEPQPLGPKLCCWFVSLGYDAFRLNGVPTRRLLKRLFHRAASRHNRTSDRERRQKPSCPSPSGSQPSAFPRLQLLRRTCLDQRQHPGAYGSGGRAHSRRTASSTKHGGCGCACRNRGGRRGHWCLGRRNKLRLGEYSSMVIDVACTECIGRAAIPADATTISSVAVTTSGKRHSHRILRRQTRQRSLRKDCSHLESMLQDLLPLQTKAQEEALPDALPVPFTMPLQVRLPLPVVLPIPPRFAPRRPQLRKSKPQASSQ